MTKTSRMIRAPGVDETVKCGEAVLPGILQGIKVNGSLETQEDSLEDTSKKQVVVKGYTTQTVQLVLTLTGTADEINRDLGTIQKIFQVDRVKAPKTTSKTSTSKTPTSKTSTTPAASTSSSTSKTSTTQSTGSGLTAARLVPFRIVNPHLDARRIKVVLFDGFTSEEDDTDDSVRCTLSFHEYDADVAKLEAKIKAQQASAAAAGKDDKGGNGGNGIDGPQGTGKLSNAQQAYVDGAKDGMAGNAFNASGEVTKLRGK